MSNTRLTLEEASREMRQKRNARFAHIRSRALDEQCELSETLLDLSEHADTACEEALKWAEAELSDRHGVPRSAVNGEISRPVVLGMGKLGGRELNYSSDIDLIFLHTENGVTDGSQSIENELYFRRLVQLVIRLLSEVTVDGFVFRVDTMLRPFGSAGPVSMSLEAAEEYYQTHGREWERYALIKARTIAGDIETGQDFVERLKPFVYRRYLDYTAIVSLRDLKRRIREDVVARKVVDDVKLGAGGIRELEFIVQSFQLVRGGQDPRLQSANLRPTLAYLGEEGLIASEVADKLDKCYVFLRKLENAIQMFDDQQTHRLPQNEAAREFVCRGLRFADWQSLLKRYEAVTDYVNDQFRQVFEAPEDEPISAPVSQLADAMLGEGPADQRTLTELSADVEGMGFDGDAQGVAQRLIELSRSRMVRGLSEASSHTLLVVVGEVLQACLEGSHPTRTAQRILDVIASIAGRSTYLTLLREEASVRDHLVRLCAASQWVTEQISASPSVLDALLDSRSLFLPPTLEEMERELADQLAPIDADDTEAGMDSIRRYRNEVALRIAAADISGKLELVQVSDHLTWLAEAVLRAALKRAVDDMQAQYGRLLLPDGSVAGIGVIAYGKFGGIEMGYGSDLDVVFVHDDIDPETESVGGERKLFAPPWFSRLAQRVIHWLSTLTPAGRAYEVDLELRPSGASGPVVVSLTRYAEYQRERAWTWEHQALTRARYVAGSAAMGESISAVRREVLSRERDPNQLASEIVKMRDKMKSHLEKNREGFWDFKQGEGGIIDCEFLTQYLVLRDASKYPELCEWTDNWRQLDTLAELNSIPAEDRTSLINAYRAYRAYAHASSLQSGESVSPLGHFAAERAAVRAAWQHQFSTVMASTGEDVQER